MDEIKADLKEVLSKLASIDKNVAVNTVDLRNHMERTVLNEQRIKSLEHWLLGLLSALLVGLIVKILL